MDFNRRDGLNETNQLLISFFLDVIPSGIQFYFYSILGTVSLTIRLDDHGISRSNRG